MAVGSQKTQSLLSLDRERNAPLFLNYGSQAVRVLVGILLFLTPFYFLTAVKEFSFYLSILIVLGLSLVFKPKIFSFESPLNLSLLLFVSWACLNLFFALNKENSLIDVFGHLLKYLVTYYLVVNFFTSPRLFRQLSWILILSATVFSYGAFIYFYLILGNPLSTLFRIHNYVYGYFHFWTVFASLLSIQLLFEDRPWRRKILLFLCLGGMFLITLLSQTRSALIAIAVGLVIYFLKNKRVFFFLLFFGAISFFTITSLSNRLSLATIHEHAKIRIGITYLFFEMIKDHPITGVGYGMQTYDDSDLLAKYNERVPLQFRQAPPVRSPHNLFTDVTVRLGLVGLALFIFILCRFIQTGWKLAKSGNNHFTQRWSLCLFGAFFAFLTNSLAMDAAFGTQAMVFYCLLAMMTILWRIAKSAEMPPTAEGKAP